MAEIIAQRLAAAGGPIRRRMAHCWSAIGGTVVWNAGSQLNVGDRLRKVDLLIQ